MACGALPGTMQTCVGCAIASSSGSWVEVASLTEAACGWGELGRSAYLLVGGGQPCASRSGFVPQVSTWDHSGFMHQRGRLMTWYWKREYWVRPPPTRPARTSAREHAKRRAPQVLHEGLLWGFNGSSLYARVQLVLPILGATPLSNGVRPCKRRPSARCPPRGADGT